VNTITLTRVMARTRAMIYSLIENELSLLPRDHYDDYMVFEQQEVIQTEDAVTRHLLRQFQKNPLFTLEHAREIGEELGDDDSILEPKFLIHNSSWDLSILSDVLDMQNGLADPQIVDRHLLANAYAHPQFTQVMEERNYWYDYETISTGEDMYVHAEIMARTKQDLTIDDCVTLVRVFGGVEECVKTSRILTNFLENTTITFGDFLNILSHFTIRGRGNALDLFWQNPFALFEREGALMSLYMKKPQLREILTELFARCDLYQIIDDDHRHTSPNSGAGAPTTHPHHPMTCLLGMVTFNPAWDPTLEAEFGDRVWGMIKYMWDREWEHTYDYVNIEDREYAFEWVQDLARMHNPSWYMPPSVLRVYTQSVIPIRLGFTVFEDIERVLSRSIALVDTNLGPPTIPMDTFEMALAKKDLVRISDICLFARANPPIEYMSTLISNTNLRGEYGMIIGRWIYRKAIIPNRRKRAMRIVRLVLSHSSLESGVCVSKYGYIRNCIASFITT
jgi:hypothetical protein